MEQNRQRLPQQRKGITFSGCVGGHLVTCSTGEYEDGTLGEIFIDMHKEGAAFRSVMNCFAIMVSLGLQHGVPLDLLVRRFSGVTFEPSGPVDGYPSMNTNDTRAASVIDFIFRVLGEEYPERKEAAE